MLRLLAAGSIGAYQRWLSPYKGYCCAWRGCTGRSSCSEHARRLVLRCGVLALWRAPPRQFERCRRAHQHLIAVGARQQAHEPFGDQAGALPDSDDPRERACSRRRRRCEACIDLRLRFREWHLNASQCDWLPCGGD